MTITMSAANPTGLTVGNGVAIANASVAGLQRRLHSNRDTHEHNLYLHGDGLGPVCQHWWHRSRQHLRVRHGGPGCGADSERRRQGAAGGDVVAFPGQSSNLSFIFDPASQTFTKTTGSLITPRELFPLVALDPAVVTGALSGHVVAFGGVDANTSACVSPNIVATTLNSAEVFDPSSQTWSAAANTMGVKRATVATLFEAGSLAGEVIVPGGVDVEAGTFPSTCVGVANLKQGGNRRD